MREKYIDLAIHKLAVAFASLDLTFHPMDTGVPGDITSYWPGSDDEDILICVFKGNQIHFSFMNIFQQYIQILLFSAFLLNHKQINFQKNISTCLSQKIMQSVRS